jgi:hypothetical protein
LTQARNISDVPVAAYAVAGDFCRIFAEDMNGLYLLSFLFTADPAKAEKCFVSGLGDSVGANRVFKEWARSWARRAIVQNAIRMMQPTRERSASSTTPVAAGTVEVSDSDARLASVLGLKTFERFVFVMSVLEGYSDQDCKTLLACSRQDIVRARLQALKHMSANEKTLVPDVAVGAGGLFVQQRLAAKTA